MTTVEAAPAPPIRPTWRGLIHRYASLSFVPLFVLLAVLASGVGDRVAVIVYGVGVMTMLAVSATYHSGRLGPAATATMKRIDHGTILLAIAGSYTAFATVGLSGAPARDLLVLVWVAAAIGVVIRMVWLHAPYPLAAGVYVVVGWSALTQWSALTTALTTGQFTLLIVGGVLYTAGGVVYAL
ncbi:MAG TPA: hemolysin III family protein, partial [Acidimicrobiales bacterium]